MEDLKLVTDAIAQAFKDSPIPRTNRQLAPMGIDACDVIRHFLGKSREQVEVDFQYDAYMEDYSYMSPMGVEYYLPSVLRIMLRQPWDDGLWIYLFGYLRPREDGKLWWNLGELSKKQLGAVEKWARYLHDQWSATPQEYLDPAEAESLAKVFGKLVREKSPIESSCRTSRHS
jgi:hypothetical protein